MKITIESTPEIALVNGKQARKWKGETESGIKIHCYVMYVAVDKNETRIEEFEKDLREVDSPTILQPPIS